MLYAKSSSFCSLQEHCYDVLHALIELRKIWSFIPEILDQAALFHDFGKAAKGFQESLLKSDYHWNYRHEVLSAAIFQGSYDISEEENKKAYLSILAHHKNLGTDSNIADVFRSCQSLTPVSRWHIKWNEMQFNELKNLFPDELANWQFIPSIKSPADMIGFYIQNIEPTFENMQQTIMRGALVAADHLASSHLSAPLHGTNINRQSVINYAKRKIKEWVDWNDIQKEVENKAEKGNALLVAPTGAGKTEASILWALKNRKGSERIFYILPYQVSINSMAERISKLFPDENESKELFKNNNVSILHSNTNLAYFQDALNNDTSTQQAQRIAMANKEASHKIYSPIKVTTVYQLLNIFFGNKFFEVGLLELTNSIIIFDEVHAYDGHTLGLILVMLEYLNKLHAKIFIMTATLSCYLKEQLKKAAHIENTQEINLLSTNPLCTEVRRRITLIESLIEDNIIQIKDIIDSSQEDGRKTVIVCNTVSKAIQIWEKLQEYKPLLIHSRFILGDRSKRESKENIDKYNVVISTQVIEVSLDVSFDTMFTELAPVDCLLQRFGRVNRHKTVDPQHLGQCIIFSADDQGSQMVYDPEILELTKKHIPEKPLCFKTACEWIEKVYPNGLSEIENKKKEDAESIFEPFVAQLKPMIDQPVDSNLEETLMSTVEVIPFCNENEWRKLKAERNHLLAKRLIVNVSYSSWHKALYMYRNRFFADGVRIDRTADKYKDHLIALFSYDSDTGLRLDKPIPPNQDHFNFIE